MAGVLVTAAGWRPGVAAHGAAPGGASASNAALVMAAAEDAALTRAQTLFAGGDRDAARNAFSRLAGDLAASPAARSLAQLGLARSYWRAGDWIRAESEYALLGTLPGAPTHHREEAEAMIRELERLGSGLPARDPKAGRTTWPVQPTPGWEYHVSPTGSDASPGTEEQPFASLERARDAVRARRLADGQGLPPGGVVIVVHGGRYPVTRTFTLGREDSGTVSAPVVIRRAPGEVPVFSGGIRVTNFEAVRDPRARARIPAEARDRVRQADLGALGVRQVPPVRLGGFASGRGFRSHPAFEVFFDGRACPLARWPNEGFAKVADVAGETAVEGHGPPGTREGVIVYTGDRPSRWVEDPDPVLYGYWFYGWADSYERVASIDPGSRRITLAPPYHGYGYRKGQPWMALNLLSELDEPGEWYLDRQTLTLFLLPESDPARSGVEASVLSEPLVALEEASHILLEGLVWELGSTDGIRIRGGEGCRVAGCTLRRLGGNGIEIEGGSGHAVVSCDVFSLGRGGVVMSGGDRRTLTPGGHLVENCHIRDLSRLDRTYTPAVLLNGVGNRIAHNLFHSIRSSALRIEGNDHAIEFNEIAHVVQESDDQGGVDMFGNPTYRGNRYRFNYFHHIGNWRNPSEGPECGQAGIRLDDMISGTLVYGNLFRRCASGRLGFGGVQIHGGKENLLDRNLFVECASAVSFSPWGLATWRERAAGALDSSALDRALYLRRYPELARLDADLNVNHLWRNLVVNCNEFLRRDARAARLMGNHVAPPGAAISGGPGGSLNLESAWELLDAAGFLPLPVSEMGLYPDSYRPSPPVERIAALRAGRAD